MSSDNERDDGAITGTYISLMLRELEMRRDPEVHEEPTAKALAFDDRGNPLLGEPIPWRLARPPDPPPPRELPKQRLRTPRVQERIAYIKQLYDAGYERGRVVEIVRARYDISEVSVLRDYAEINRVYVEADRDPNVLLERKARMRVELRDLEDEARAKGDLRTAALLKDKRAKLDGLYAPKKHEHAVEHTVALQLEKVTAALDERGLEALEIVMGQLAAKGVSSPALPVGTPIDIVADDVNGPVQTYRVDDDDDREDDDGD